MRVLLLGGTGDAWRLARLLAGRDGFEVVSSLAGRTADPARPPTQVRIGGFGGAKGLTSWLKTEGIEAVVDATHPFATAITASAMTAANAADVPLLLLLRPGWTESPGDDWRRVPSLEAAAANLPGERVFLTTGRMGLHPFAQDGRRWYLVRSVDPPEPPLPHRKQVVLGRGPFTVDEELALMRDYAIDVLVTKDSGGTMTAAKLTAARLLEVPVVMVDRPPAPEAPTVTSADEALSWLAGLAGA